MSADNRLLMQSGRTEIPLPEGEPLFLAGFANRKAPASGVVMPLEVNAVVLRSSEKSAPLAIVSGDVLYFTEAIRHRILERIEDGGALSAERLLLFASHAHTAPATDDGKPRLGDVSPRFVEDLAAAISDLLSRLSKAPAVEVSLEHKRVPMAHAVCRRRRGTWLEPRSLRLSHGVYMGPNPAATRDDTADMVRFVASDGSVQAVLWSYACHPSAYPNKTEIHPDFIGVVRQRVRRGTGEALPVLYLQGATGDRRPLAESRRRTLREFVKRLLGRVSFPVFDERGWREWSDSLAMRIAGALANGGWDWLNPELGVSESDIPLEELITSLQPTGTASLHVRAVSLAREFRIVAINAEVVAAYRELVARAVPEPAPLVVGYEGEVFGYLPTDRMIAEGGYEAADFFPYFGLSGRFSDHIEGRVVQAAEAALAALKSRENAGLGS